MPTGQYEPIDLPDRAAASLTKAIDANEVKSIRDKAEDARNLRGTRNGNGPAMHRYAQAIGRTTAADQREQPRRLAGAVFAF